MTDSHRWTSQDLPAMPDDGKRYEVIDGQLYITEIPHINHQFVTTDLLCMIDRWEDEANIGNICYAPGVIFSDDESVAPDLTWIKKETLKTALGKDGYLHSASELIVEVLSPGTDNEKRDFEIKRELYSRRGVSEYWIVSWQRREIYIYRRDPEAQELRSGITLRDGDNLTSPLLEGFSCPVSEVFEGII